MAVATLVRAVTLSDLRAAGGCLSVNIEGHTLALFAYGEQVYAVDNRCPHMGFPLHRGSTQDGILTCHWHHARFDLASGCTFDLWADDVPSYPVEIRNGEVWVTVQSNGTGAQERWQRVLSFVRSPSMADVPPQNKLPDRVYGFSHHTYSDSKYKREVMTPLYTQAVNRATFEALEHEGRQLTSKRVTIVGGGAMGLNAGLELREKGYEVKFVEPDAERRGLLEKDHHFVVEPFETALRDRGLVLDSGGPLPPYSFTPPLDDPGEEGVSRDSARPPA